MHHASPQVCTSRPIASFVSVVAQRGRLIVLVCHTPLNADGDEVMSLANAVIRATSRGSYVAFHAPTFELHPRIKSARALLGQLERIRDHVTTARGAQAERVRYYHLPRMLFPPTRRGIGWDLVIADRSSRGIEMRRHTWEDMITRRFVSVPAPHADPLFAPYEKMVRSVTRPKTPRFPLPLEWQPHEGISEVPFQLLDDD